MSILMTHGTLRRTAGPLAVMVAFAAPLLRAHCSPEPAVIEPLHQSITVTAEPLGARLEVRNGRTFTGGLFVRDDQLFQMLNAGINAGQHEGGGKSLEIRRYGFDLDHGGGDGGLRVTVDKLPKNQSAQGHGQGGLARLRPHAAAGLTYRSSRK